MNRPVPLFLAGLRGNRPLTDSVFRGTMDIYCTGHLHKPQENRQANLCLTMGKLELSDTFTSGSEV